MDRGYSLYGPKGLQMLMERSPSAADYFDALPEDVRSRLLRHARSIDSEDSLHAQAQQWLRAR